LGDIRGSEEGMNLGEPQLQTLAKVKAMEELKTKYENARLYVDQRGVKGRVYLASSISEIKYEMRSHSRTVWEGYRQGSDGKRLLLPRRRNGFGGLLAL
jgi:hypothetical protein